MIDVLLDALIDSLKVFGFSIVIFLVLSFFEERFAKIITKHKKATPIIASLTGLIPQCGVSVVAADLYHKRHITVGTLLALFFACSDEALPILLTDKDKIIMVIPLLIIKFIGGFLLGYFIDFIISKPKINEEVVESIDVSYCHTHHHKNKLHKHFLHPLDHSLKIFLYVFVMNILFGMLIYYVGEDTIINFMIDKKIFTPIICCLVGLIPNCASSVIICELFLLNSIPFAALVGGLCVNSGLGFLYLFKYKDERINVLKMISIILLYSLIISYIILFIMW